MMMITLCHQNTGCTPKFILLDENGGLETELRDDEDFFRKPEVVVREGAGFRMFCRLSLFHSLKWTINNREITYSDQEKWNMVVDSDSKPVNGTIFTELTVYNASTNFHQGEYKCTPVCLYDSPRANVGVKVTVSIG
jgi:hypothetical protein